MSTEELRTSLPSFEEMQIETERRNHHVREQWVKQMETKLVRDELNKCYKGEGVNQMQNCKELAERYIDMLQTHKFTGYHVVDH